MSKSTVADYFVVVTLYMHMLFISYVTYIAAICPIKILLSYIVEIESCEATTFILVYFIIFKKKRFEKKNVAAAVVNLGSCERERGRGRVQYRWRRVVLTV